MRGRSEAEISADIEQAKEVICRVFKDGNYIADPISLKADLNRLIEYHNECESAAGGV